MRGTMFGDVRPIKTQDLTEHYVRIDVRLAIDNMIHDMLVAGDLHDAREADDLRSDLYSPSHMGFPLNVVERLDRFLTRNSIKDIMEFFSSEGKPVTNNEIDIFWGSLSVADRMFFMCVPLY